MYAIYIKDVSLTWAKGKGLAYYKETHIASSNHSCNPRQTLPFSAWEMVVRSFPRSFQNSQLKKEFYGRGLVSSSTGAWLQISFHTTRGVDFHFQVSATEDQSQFTSCPTRLAMGPEFPQNGSKPLKLNSWPPTRDCLTGCFHLNRLRGWEQSGWKRSDETRDAHEVQHKLSLSC